MIEALFYGAIALQVLDVATTYYALTSIKGTYETNGIMAKIMAKLGLIPTLLLKLAVAVGVLVWSKASPDAVLILGAACAIYTLIVVNNIMVMRRAGD